MCKPIDDTTNTQLNNYMDVVKVVECFSGMKNDDEEQQHTQKNE